MHHQLIAGWNLSDGHGPTDEHQVVKAKESSLTAYKYMSALNAMDEVIETKDDWTIISAKTKT